VTALGREDPLPEATPGACSAQSLRASANP